MDKRRVEDILVSFVQTVWCYCLNEEDAMDKRRVEDILVSFVQTVWCYCLKEGNG